MKSILKISIRFLLSGKGSTQLVSFIALLGVSLGVSALLLTMGVFAGFQHELKEKILSASPHIIVSLLDANKDYKDKIENIEGIKNVYSVALYQGLVSREGRISSVSVKALTPEDAYRIYGVKLREGVAVGAGLADILGLKKDEEILLLSPMGQRTPFGFLPRARSYVVEGIFQKGVFDQDYATVVMDIKRARDFFGDSYQLSGYEIYLRDPYKAQEIRNKIERLLGPGAIVRSWIDLNKPLFNALQVEKVGIFFVLMLMIVIASFNITSLLFMKARDKMKDIAVLRTFGLKSRQVIFIFLLQGLMLGSLGTLIGLILSLVGAYFINEYKLIRVPADVYLMDHVPVYFEMRDVISTLLGALLLSLLSSLLPAYRASREGIVRVLRNE
ncbi:MAG: ABC transporter permease [Aquificota bacterium]|jgi:lipoprotein-releasing system permease protein|nr:ABC transporter permease [Aquificaceae bacterium]MDM7267487.1 ABC transporter permease [Aquificaceae bacterium]